MSDRAAIHRKVEEYFENLWRSGDPWGFGSSEYERLKYVRQVQLLSDRRYRRVLKSAVRNVRKRESNHQLGRNLNRRPGQRGERRLTHVPPDRVQITRGKYETGSMWS